MMLNLDSRRWKAEHRNAVVPLQLCSAATENPREFENSEERNCCLLSIYKITFCFPSLCSISVINLADIPLILYVYFHFRCRFLHASSVKV